ncbi:UNVERIFIED_CONTAM: hypothetical protein HDU68_004703 [Siphonaria sp. JEL0065]|nr:hypothetical protein HDU68_004703 [Siphonaria sp. JEL0065]
MDQPNQQNGLNKHALPPKPKAESKRKVPISIVGAAQKGALNSNPNLPLRPSTAEHQPKKQRLNASAASTSQTQHNQSHRQQQQHNNQFHQQHNNNRKQHNHHMNPQRKNFVTTYGALVNALRAALADPALRESSFDAMSQSAQQKVLATQKKKLKTEGNHHGGVHLADAVFLPVVNENGLLLGHVKRLVEAQIDFKPYWTTRHHSQGGLSSFVSFFPAAFKINKGGKHLNPPVMSPVTNESLPDQDRLAFVVSNNPRLDIQQIYNDYEKSGFDTPLPIESELNFALIPCTLPERGFEIVYAATKKSCDKFVMEEIVLRVEQDGTWTPKPDIALGFDTETTQEMWVSIDPKLPPSLLQISTNTKCLLVHQAAITPSLPQSIIWVLTHPLIKKVVANAAQEIIDLRKFNGLEAKGVVDIAHEQVVGSVASGGGAHVRQAGLAKLAALYLGLRMKKPKNIQVGNWTRPLNQAQMDYAATDAWVSLLVYQVLARIPRKEIQRMKVAVEGREDCDMEDLKEEVESEGDDGRWWEHDIVRRVAVVNGVHDQKWSKRLLDSGMERIVGTGTKGVTVFAEKPSNRVDSLVLSEFYARI